MKKTNQWKLLLVVVIIALGFILPCPAGLDLVSWRILALYVGTIIGLIIKPFPYPVLLLSSIGLSGIIIAVSPKIASINSKLIFSGYASGTVWLVFSAFTFSIAFIETNLGKRIAYLLIKKMGSSLLKLGYVNVILEVILAPITPSNTARAGGIISPIFNSISLALGSTSDSPEKGGRYLMTNVYMTTKTTSYIFLTGMAPNMLALSLIQPILGINLTWLHWFLAACVPGFICLLITPLIGYMCDKPTLKKVNNKEIAEKGLSELGVMSSKEKILIGIFVLALLGWVFGSFLHIPAAIVAIVALMLLLILKIIDWDGVLKNKGGWNTLIWYGGIIGLSKLLTKLKFFDWLAHQMENMFGHINLGGSYGALIFILAVSVFIRYLFASGGAYIAAMIPVFAIVGKTLGVSPEILALGILFSSAYGGMLTHYGGAAGPLILGYGFNSNIKPWWVTGGAMATINLIVHCTIGYLWWKFLISSAII